MEESQPWPWPAVVVVWVIAAVLILVGGVAHVVDLVRHGLWAHAWAPGWLNLYWSSLAVLDPLAAVLLLRGKRIGLDLACGVMVTDLAANLYAAYGLRDSGLLAEPGLQRIVVFALFVFGAAPFVRRWLVQGPLSPAGCRSGPGTASGPGW
ncbi:hypothetical protein [Streptomyces sp. ADI98-10]|uniref:hypothetical protein n=1 Tax=Streptomyces sp. ADI98-10 TaxID=1522763 RepID=UPI000FACEF34|nr:hypothetical protein [Streptomyces sp. ADI98-10]RPK83643.1 hypothetical protein EES46_25135 [Streptomyces sp. ADI98-10]